MKPDTLGPLVPVDRATLDPDEPILVTIRPDSPTQLVVLGGLGNDLDRDRPARMRARNYRLFARDLAAFADDGRAVDVDVSVGTRPETAQVRVTRPGFSRQFLNERGIMLNHVCGDVFAVPVRTAHSLVNEGVAVLIDVDIAASNVAPIARRR
jgi:hypothetical protein